MSIKHASPCPNSPVCHGRSAADLYWNMNARCEEGPKHSLLGPPVVQAFTNFFGWDASPTKIDYRKKGYPYSNLFTGGPSCLRLLQKEHERTTILFSHIGGSVVKSTDPKAPKGRLWTNQGSSMRRFEEPPGIGSSYACARDPGKKPPVGCYLVLSRFPGSSIC